LPREFLHANVIYVQLKGVIYYNSLESLKKWGLTERFGEIISLEKNERIQNENRINKISNKTGKK